MAGVGPAQGRYLGLRADEPRSRTRFRSQSGRPCKQDPYQVTLAARLHLLEHLSDVSAHGILGDAELILNLTDLLPIQKERRDLALCGS